MKVVKRVNGFHLKRCPEGLTDMDESVEQSVSETRDPEVHPRSENGSEEADSSNGSEEVIPPLPTPLSPLTGPSREKRFCGTANNSLNEVCEIYNTCMIGIVITHVHVHLVVFASLMRIHRRFIHLHQ